MQERPPYNGPIPDHIRTHMEKAEGVIERGGEVYWKFTCRNCRSRQTFDEPNALFLSGTCEACGAVTEVFSADADCGFDAWIPAISKLLRSAA